jgi:hypothetical protein
MSLEQAIYAIIAIPLFAYLMVMFALFIMKMAGK